MRATSSQFLPLLLLSLAAAQPLVREAFIPFWPGITGRIDHMTYDNRSKLNQAKKHVFMMCARDLCSEPAVRGHQRK